MPLLTAYERTQQVQGKTLAFFDNNATLSDPLGLAIKKTSTSHSDSMRTTAGKTVSNLGVSVQAALALTNPVQYGIVTSPVLYPPPPPATISFSGAYTTSGLYTRFTSTGTVTVANRAYTLNYFAIGGGGGGSTFCGGGGGAGGLKQGGLALAPGTYTVTIGQGGAAATGSDGTSAAYNYGSKGGNTTLGSLVTAYGGGGGATHACPTSDFMNGGCGGGGGWGTDGGTGSQGFDSGPGVTWYGRGGGGLGGIGFAAANGRRGGNGGVGITFNGTNFGGGGAGGGGFGTGGGYGSYGGGDGDGGGTKIGAPNTGGGGGGGGTDSGGGSGGSGILIFYTIPEV